jgi:hypothetical protein
MTMPLFNRIANLAVLAIVILGLCSCSSEEVQRVSPWDKHKTEDQIRVRDWGRSNDVVIHLLRQEPPGEIGGTLSVDQCTDAKWKEFLDNVASPDLFLVTEIRITANKISDVGIQELPRFKEARIVFLDGTDITGQGLSNLEDLTKLEDLSLRGTRITGPALAYLAKLPNLRHLTLSNCELVSDSGLTHVARMQNLVQLLLEDTGITDAGLSRLHGLTKLQVINIENNLGVTNAGVVQLEAALPNARVFSDYWQPPPTPDF